MSKSEEDFSNSKTRTVRRHHNRFINPRVYKSLDLEKVYEIAVQMEKGQRRTPVLIVKPKDGATSLTWATVFPARICRHMNRLTRLGAKIYIRPCTVSEKFEFKQNDESNVVTLTYHGACAVQAYMVHNYDYAWCISRRAPIRQLLVKGGANIGLL